MSYGPEVEGLQSYVYTLEEDSLLYIEDTLQSFLLQRSRIGTRSFNN